MDSREEKMRQYAKKLRQNMTPQERRLWYDFLRFHRLKWVRQKVIGTYIVDFYCHAACCVIEIDGGQHFDGNGYCLYDKNRDAFLTEKHLTVLRFTNDEIEKQFEEVCKKIDRHTSGYNPSTGYRRSPSPKRGG